MASLSWKEKPSRLTRGVNVDFLIRNQNWWTGSYFLKETIPKAAEPGFMKDEYISKLKKDFKSDNSDILITVNVTTDYNFLNCLFNLSNDLMYVLRVLSFFSFQIYQSCEKS